MLGHAPPPLIAEAIWTYAGGHPALMRASRKRGSHAPALKRDVEPNRPDRDWKPQSSSRGAAMPHRPVRQGVEAADGILRQTATGRRWPIVRKNGRCGPWTTRSFA